MYSASLKPQYSHPLHTSHDSQLAAMAIMPSFCYTKGVGRVGIWDADSQQVLYHVEPMTMTVTSQKTQEAQRIPETPSSSTSFCSCQEASIELEWAHMDQCAYQHPSEDDMESLDSGIELDGYDYNYDYNYDCECKDDNDDDDDDDDDDPHKYIPPELDKAYDQYVTNCQQRLDYILFQTHLANL